MAERVSRSNLQLPRSWVTNRLSGHALRPPDRDVLWVADGPVLKPTVYLTATVSHQGPRAGSRAVGCGNGRVVASAVLYRGVNELGVSWKPKHAFAPIRTNATNPRPKDIPVPQDQASSAGGLARPRGGGEVGTRNHHRLVCLRQAYHAEGLLNDRWSAHTMKRVPVFALDYVEISPLAVEACRTDVDSSVARLSVTKHY